MNPMTSSTVSANPSSLTSNLVRAAYSADDRPLGAHILSEMAYQAAHQRQPAEAVTLTETAVVGTRGQQTPRLLAELYIHRAHAFVAMQDASACTAAISQARTHVEQGTTDEDPPYLHWVRPTILPDPARRGLGASRQAVWFGRRRCPRHSGNPPGREPVLDPQR